MKHSAVAPSSGLSVTLTASRAGEQNLSRGSSRRQGAFSFIFGLLMRSQLDSDLLASSANPSSAPAEAPNDGKAAEVRSSAVISSQ
eukprot:gene9963-11013_t